ncbi:hypothetical protein VKT23_003029 [Stygiomarasmius scandens]|uniref:CTLH domain-containing protein n=1 Tax=Marasmiellus scandens TaxID=2682957 RepID=A0ABR1JWQ5_9AGAR
MTRSSKKDERRIDQEDAHAILDVLQLIDSDGLLDRVFNTNSLRSLLQQSASFSDLKATVHSLVPIHAHPRARPSKPAAHQLSFCNLALSLLDQAASHSLQLPLDRDSLIAEPSSPSSAYISPRYALAQHLPSGTYWSSLTDRNLKDLAKGHAELVSVLPSPLNTSLDDVPTLGSYNKPVPAPSRSILLDPHKVSHGHFLDYGIWASFAPSFDQDGVELGRKQLGEFYYDRQQRRTRKQIAIDRFNQQDQPMEEHSFDQDLLPPEQVAQLKGVLDSLQLESAVTELLDRNRKALQRLQFLQYLRLTSDPNSTVEQGSEEWDTAQGIMDSLTLLASLRPRSTTDDLSPLIPSPAALHLLHRTLPLSPSPGWHGNLPPTRSTALRDDSTIKVRPGTTIPAPTPVTATPAATNPYSGYQYSHYRTTTPSAAAATSSSTSSYIQYKPTQTSYYQGATAYAPQASTSQTPYYAQQPYGVAGWYNAYNPTGTTTTATNGTGTGSGSGGRGTPQPGVATPAPSYSSFFSNSLSSSLMGLRTPAVGNTVLNNKTGTPTPTAPTLPAHLQTRQTPQNGTTVTSYYQNWGQPQTTSPTPPPGTPVPR